MPQPSLRALATDLLAVRPRKFFKTTGGFLKSAPETLLVLGRLFFRTLRGHQEKSLADSVQALFEKNRVWIINLDDRLDRKEDYEGRFMQMFGCLPKRFSAFKRANGHLGCAESHLGILTAAIETDPESALAVFEDDIEFLGSHADVIEAVAHFLADERLDVLLFGYNTSAYLPRLKQGLRLVSNSATTSGYIAKPKALEALRDTASESIRLLEGGIDPAVGAIDVVWQRLQTELYTLRTFYISTHKKPLHAFGAVFCV